MCNSDFSVVGVWSCLHVEFVLRNDIKLERVDERPVSLQKVRVNNGTGHQLVLVSDKLHSYTYSILQSCVATIRIYTLSCFSA